MNRAPYEKIVANQAEMEALAQEIALQVKPGWSIGLCGELGAGKTTFTRSFVKALGGQEPVSSPTFVLQHEYKINNGTLEHWDLYRLRETPEDFFEAVATDRIRVIEWADKFEEVLHSLELRIDISFPDRYTLDTSKMNEHCTERRVRVALLRHS